MTCNAFKLLPHVAAVRRDVGNTAAAADDDDEDDDVRLVTSRSCYRQRVTYDVKCLSEEPNEKYRIFLDVKGSDHLSLLSVVVIA